MLTDVNSRRAPAGFQQFSTRARGAGAGEPDRCSAAPITGKSQGSRKGLAFLGFSEAAALAFVGFFGLEVGFCRTGFV
jgi:hypothetical protein